MDKIKIAIEMATKYHGQQKYGDEPYINHLKRVYKSVKDAGYGEDYQIVALLHDIIEDTNVGYDQIERLFGVKIASAIACLTHDTKESYHEYLVYEVMHNEISMVVKFFDVLDNFEHSILNEKYSSLTKKYKKALHTLVFEGK
jgi:(p)ppGpp synthase/HD superfamily hydrolase